MPIYKERRRDCKYYVEKSLQTLGYKTNSTLQEKYAEKECGVIYSSFTNQVETQMTYYNTIWIKIILEISDNNEIPTTINAIVKKVTKDVELSEAPYCSSFYFGNVDVFPLGSSNRVEFNARYSTEIQWYED